MLFALYSHSLSLSLVPFQIPVARCAAVVIVVISFREILLAIIGEQTPTTTRKMLLSLGLMSEFCMVSVRSGGKSYGATDLGPPPSPSIVYCLHGRASKSCCNEQVVEFTQLESMCKV